jgi:predicted RNA polymerase sigma factor
VLAELLPSEPEVHGLVGLIEIQTSRAAARVGPTGEPILVLTSVVHQKSVDFADARRFE